MTLLVILGFVVIATILGAVYLSLKSTRDDDETPARDYGREAGRDGITRAGGTRPGTGSGRPARPAASPSLSDLVQSAPGNGRTAGRPGRRAADVPGPRGYPAARRGYDETVVSAPPTVVSATAPRGYARAASDDDYAGPSGGDEERQGRRRSGRPQKPRLRMGRGRHDDDPWPVAGGDDLSDEQFWAEVSSGEPAAPAARPSGQDAGTTELPPAAQRGPGPFTGQGRRGRDEPARPRQPADGDPLTSPSFSRHAGLSRHGGMPSDATRPYSPRGQQPPPPHGGRSPSMADTQALAPGAQMGGVPGTGPRSASPGTGRREPGRHGGGYRDGAYGSGDYPAYHGNAPAHGNGYSPAAPYPDAGYEAPPEGRSQDGWQAPAPDDRPYGRRRSESSGTRYRGQPSYGDRYDDRTDPHGRY